MEAIEFARDRLLVARTAFESGDQERFVAEVSAAAERLRVAVEELKAAA